jgi:putative PIG3 family NAD(P)H quinone oxidoreductase
MAPYSLLADTMRAILFDQPGGPDVLHVGDTASPTLGRREIRITVRATAVNRADLLQREGHYPPPAGASPILGLECAGVVANVGDEVTGWSPGERVMALLAGGGYAEEVVVDAGSVMRVPAAMPFDEAGAIPEVFLTAFSNIFMLARAKPGESILIHGGGSGVGTAATTLCKLAGLRVIVTAGSDEKCGRCLDHGADVAINYRNEDFIEKARGVDIVLDHLGARYLPRDLEALNLGGRVVIIGSMGGERVATIDVTKLLGKRQQIIGSTLRGRSLDEKAAIVAAFVAQFGKDLESGRIHPVIDSVFTLEEASLAHLRMASGENFGKVALRVS